MSHTPDSPLLARLKDERNYPMARYEAADVIHSMADALRAILAESDTIQCGLRMIDALDRGRAALKQAGIQE